jgi:hypothetical protein
MRSNDSNKKFQAKDDVAMMANKSVAAQPS